LRTDALVGPCPPQVLFDRLLDDARLCRFCIPDLTGLMDVLVSEADVSNGGGHILFWKMPYRAGIILSRGNLAPLLGCIVFIGETALCCGFDLKSVCLRPMRLGDQFIMCAPLPLQTCGLLCCIVGNGSEIAGIKHFRRSRGAGELIGSALNESGKASRLPRRNGERGGIHAPGP
jgi:hypothetical protein